MRKLNWKKIVAGTLSAVMLLSVTACGSSSTKSESASTEAGKKKLTKVTFCLDWTPNTNHTGIYAAKALGYYEDAGLDVEIVQPPENGAATMCASGQAQFAIEAQDTMAAALDSDNPLGITAVAGLIQHNTSGIISRKGDGITSPKGLEGKTYSTWESPIEQATLKTVMKDEGADFSKVKLIPNNITDEPAALKANQTDAIWVFYGWGGINAEVEGVDCDYWNFKDIDSVFDYYTPVMIANNDFLKNSPDEAKAFLAATKKGYQYAIDNPKKAADLLIAEGYGGTVSQHADVQAYLTLRVLRNALDGVDVDTGIGTADEAGNVLSEDVYKYSEEERSYYALNAAVTADNYKDFTDSTVVWKPVSNQLDSSKHPTKKVWLNIYNASDNFLSSTYQPLLQNYDDLLNLDVEYIGGDGQTESNVTNRLGNPSQYDAFAINMVKTDNAASYTAILNQ